MFHCAADSVKLDRCRDEQLMFKSWWELAPQDLARHH